MKRLVILSKAKYTKRWKGKDGKWHYEYPQAKKGRTKKDITDTPEFKRWFKDSKVVGKSGKPLVVYHGTPVGEFDEFMTDVPVDKRNFIQSKGAFFSSSTNTASEYTFNYRKMLPAAERLEQKKSEAMRAHIAAKQAGDTELAQKYNDEYYRLHDLDMKTYPDMKDKLFRGPVYPVYLSIQNPLVVDAEGKYWYEVMPDIYKKDLSGYDGIIFKNMIEIGEPQDTYVVFEPTQVKSKFNRGTFNSRDPKINKSLQKAKYLKRWKGPDGKWRYKYKETAPPKGKYEKAVAEMEDFCLKFYGNKSEVGVSLDAKGNVLTETYGDANSVRYSNEDIKKLNGARVHIHNHPSDVSFSMADMAFGIINNIKEMRVVTEKHIYIYRPPEKREPYDREEGRIRVELAKSAIQAHWERASAANYDRVHSMHESGLVTREEASHVFQNDLVETFAKNYGGTYIRMKK
jgi:hypothetical protein